jgi:hypothetical protein
MSGRRLVPVLVRQAVDTSDARTAAAALHCLRCCLAAAADRFTATEEEASHPVASESEIFANEALIMARCVDGDAGPSPSPSPSASSSPSFSTALPADVAAIATKADRSSRIELVDHVVSCLVQCKLQLRAQLYLLPHVDKAAQLRFGTAGDREGEGGGLEQRSSSATKADAAAASTVVDSYVDVLYKEQLKLAPARVRSALAELAAADASFAGLF